MTSSSEPIDNVAQPTGRAASDVSFGPFRLYPRARLLERDGEPVRLGSRALDLLYLLASRPGDVVRKDELLATAWPDLTVDESSLRFHIAQLRRALGERQNGERFISNVPGRGYCFVAPVKGAPVQGVVVGAPILPRPPEAPPLGRLPHRLARMVGRDETLPALADHLAAHRFVTLRGPGGIGKTTVAVALAHELEPDFEDGVRFLDLGSLPDPRLVTSAAASALGLQVSVEDATPPLVRALRERRMLLVLDSCEHLIDAVARLAEQIHQEAPGVVMLATSREALQVEGEYIFDLTPLDCPAEAADAAADELLGYAAPRLFFERAAAAGFTGTMTDADARIVSEVCRKLDGLPLAIELVAGRVSTLGLAETAELLDGRLRLAWRGRRTAAPRHQTLGAALDWSYELLPTGERDLLARLSVFPGAFTLQGALAIAEGPDPSDAVVQALEQLVAKSLVGSRYDVGQAHFRLLETTRGYAAQRLAASGGSADANRRHADYVVQALTPRSYQPGGARPGGWRRRAELLADVRAALAWAFSEGGEAATRSAIAAVGTRLLLELDLLKECRTWAQRALAELDEGFADRAAQVELLWAFGHTTMFTDRNGEESEGALRRGRELAQSLGDLRSEFRLLSRLHAFYRRTGERRRLLEVSQRAEAVAAELGDRAAIARAQTYIGVAHHLGGNQALAKRNLDAGRSGDEAIPNLPIDHFASPRGTNIISCTNLWLLGLPDQAVELSRGLLDPKANPDLPMYAAGLCFAARVFCWVGDIQALEDATDRLALCSGKHGLAPFLTVSESLRGEASLARGEVDRGVELLNRALPRMYEDRFELYAAAAASALAQGLAMQGQPAKAMTLIEQTIQRVASQGDSCDMPDLLRVRGALRIQLGERDAADADFRASLALAERHASLGWQLRTAIERAQATGPAGRRSAMDDLRATHSRFSEGFDTTDLRTARGLLDRR
jgi:predicted ATPase/DNA-binding winged helix-turn-helix (wHTH) protein